MSQRTSRSLTAGEERALTPGLLSALRRVGADPQIVAMPHPGARLARLWRGGSTPILAWRDRIFWPGALEDFAGQARLQAVLQHELQHVLEYRTGDLGPFRYLLRPHNWRYRYHPAAGAKWGQFGAEQRAQIVEDLWLIERGLIVGEAPLAWYRQIVPWA